MSVEETESIFSYLIGYGLEGVVAGLVVFLLLKFFLPSYLSQKGKNLATREDIEEITNKVESVKSDYAHILEELKSENKLKFAAIEREKDLKKEVYLMSVEALTRSLNVISSFSNLNLSEEVLVANFSKDSGQIAKIQIVGSKETVKAVTHLIAEISSSTFDLMLERSSLIQRQNSIIYLEQMRDKAEKEIERYIEFMKKLNIEQNYDQGVWDTINSNIDFETKQSEKYTSEIEELWKLQNGEHLNFSRKCMDKFFEISALLPELVLSVRKELNMDIDEDDYLEITNKNIETGKNIFNAFLENVANESV